MTKEKTAVDQANSTVSFQVKKLGLLTVKGAFTDVAGQVIVNKDDMQNAQINANVGASTVNTENQKRDEHLKSKDFFSVKEFPKITFVSTDIKATKGAYEASGSLSMLGTTKEVTIPFTLQDDVFNGSFSLNRKAFGLGAKFPAWIVGNNIQVSIKAELK